MPTTNGWVRADCSGGNCVEMKVQWVKAAACADNACVEVAEGCGASTCVEVGECGQHILIRDSKNPDREPLHFTREEIRAFFAGVKAGDFDRFLGGSDA
jgi:hypothetical protein